MADFSTVVTSVSVTLAVQSLYIVLVKSPEKLQRSMLQLSHAGTDFANVTSEVSVCSSTIRDSSEARSAALRFLLQSSPPDKLSAVKEGLVVSKAKLTRLTTMPDPLPKCAELATETLDRMATLLEVPVADQVELRLSLLSTSYQALQANHSAMHYCKVTADNFASELDSECQDLQSTLHLFRLAALAICVISLAYSWLFLHYLWYSTHVYHWLVWIIGWCVLTLIGAFSDRLRGVVRDAANLVSSTRISASELRTLTASLTPVRSESGAEGELQ